MLTGDKGTEILPGLSGWDYEAAYWFDSSAYAKGHSYSSGLFNVKLYLSRPDEIEFNVGFGSSHDFSIHPETEC